MEVDQGEPCPFVYAKGKKCTGHIWRIEAFKVDISWSRADDGKWSFAVGEPRPHYHLYCSEKGNHAGYGREDAMKRYYQDLPPTLRKVVTRFDSLRRASSTE
jgi:hypothetical protein